MPDYHGPVSLSLVVGPAHAGKVGTLLDGFVAALDRDPWLIVPQRADVERVERELLERQGGLLAGTIGTFDTLFDTLARGNGGGRRLLGEAERGLLIRRLSVAASAEGARFSGFADAVGRALAELDSALLRRTTSPSRSPRSPGPTTRGSTGSTPGIEGFSAASPSTGWRVISAHGERAPCSRTASRT